MGKTYEKAGDDVLNILNSILDTRRKDLVESDVTFDVLMESAYKDEELVQSLRHGGYPAAAVIKVVSLKQRALGDSDVLLTIDQYCWEELDQEARVALIDHELEHVRVKAVEKGIAWVSIDGDGNKWGTADKDDLGRPKIKMRLHDWQLGGFESVAKRHGENALEIRELKRCAEANSEFLDQSELGDI